MAGIVFKLFCQHARMTDAPDRSGFLDYLLEEDADSRAPGNRPRLAAFQAFLEHPENTPTLPEAAFIAYPVAWTDEPADRPALEADVEEVYDDLAADYDMVEAVALPVDDPDMPDVAYRLTDDARDYLAEETNLLGVPPGAAEDAWERIYAAVKKPDEIEEYEALPRPD